jgi:hypothetical protein
LAKVAAADSGHWYFPRGFSAEGWINGCNLGSIIWTVERAAALHPNELVEDYAVECSAPLTSVRQ